MLEVVKINTTPVAASNKLNAVAFVRERITKKEAVEAVNMREKGENFVHPSFSRFRGVSKALVAKAHPSV